MDEVAIVEWQPKTEKPCPADSFQDAEQGSGFLASL